MENIFTILKEYYGLNIHADQWVELTPKITVISLNQEANIYTDIDEVYNFTSKGILKIAKKYTKSADGSYKSFAFIDMDKISGLISTSVMGPSGTYFERPY